MTEKASQPREERRVVTVVFTDLVGFTERSEELDPEDVRALLTEYYTRARSILEEHGGTVDKFIGDAVLGVFGAPVAHEDDPERAVRAALAICEWARGRDDLAVRAGVNTGTAFVALEPSDTGIGIVAGDMVNTASRIQSAAPTGRVLVGEETKRATADVFEWAEHAPIEAKGKSAPLRVWEPTVPRVAVGARAPRIAAAPLVGRARELDSLRRAFERAAAGTAQRLTIVGVPGIGKTRLAAELERVAREQHPDVTWLRGRSLPYGAGTAFRALSETVRAHAGIVESDDTDEAAAKLDAVVAALAEDESEARWLASELRPLVGLAEAAEARADVFAAWRRFFELLARRGPLVLVFDDLHWADDAVLDFLDELMRSERAALLVVATARPELLERRPALDVSTDSHALLRVEPLSTEETSMLLRTLAGELALDGDAEAALVARAAGNPLYAEELVRMLSEEGHDPGAALPQSLRGIVAARLDALSEAEAELLRDACVVGQSFWPGALRHLADDPRDVEGLLARLERKEYVVTSLDSTLAGEREITFRHPLIREVAYERIPRARRAEKHRRAAEWAERLPVDRAERRAELLAEHSVLALEYTIASGGEVGELRPRAARALRESADRARAVLALGLAATRYADALELVDDDVERAVIELGLAEAELRTGAVDEAHGRLARVVEVARTHGLGELLARAALARGGVGIRVFDPDEALVALLHEANDALGAGHPALRARLLARLAIEVYYEDPATLREELSDRALRLAREAGEPDALLDALNARRVTLWSPDHLDERLAVSRELVELAEATGDRERSLVSRTWLVVDLVERGELEAARREIDEYARLAEPLDIPAYSWWTHAWRAMLAGVEGRFDDLRRLADEAAAIGSEAGDTNATIYRDLARWIADAEQGRDPERWMAQLEEGVARGGPSDAFRCGLAMQLALAGRLDDARNALAALGPAGFGAVVKDMNFYAGAGEYAVAVGILDDTAAARQAYEILLPYAERTFVIARAAVCWGPAESFLGHLAAVSGLLDEAERHFCAALEACERMGARAMAARTRWWYATMLCARDASGDAGRAADLAAAAEAEAEAMGLVLEPVQPSTNPSDGSDR